MQNVRIPRFMGKNIKNNYLTNYLGQLDSKLSFDYAP